MAKSNNSRQLASRRCYDASHNERSNLEVAKTILKPLGKGDELIGYVKDRLGHDRRYAIDPHKRTHIVWCPGAPRLVAFC